jgi:hypothetical protein
MAKFATRVTLDEFLAGVRRACLEVYYNNDADGKHHPVDIACNVSAVVDSIAGYTSAMDALAHYDPSAKDNRP